MNKYILVLFLLILPKCLLCQTDDVWQIGTSNPVPMELNFSSGNLDSTINSRTMSFFITNASISDTAGNLLFYTNGNYIDNSIYSRMSNSTAFNPSLTADTTLGLNMPQGVIIIPKPGNQFQYYVFHINYEYFFLNGDHFQPLELRYTLVDMRMNNGRGDVDTNYKTIKVIDDTLGNGRLAACKHANGRDWWIISHQYNSNLFYKVLVTPDTMIVSSQIIGSILTNNNPAGHAIFNRDGTKFAVLQWDTIADVMDFNRCSGLFSNYNLVPISGGEFPYGMEFSPSGRFLYVSTFLKLYQYDLTAANIQASRILIDTLDNFTTFATRQYFFNMKLAPNNRIYITSFCCSSCLHQITNPDSLGIACNLIQHSVCFSAWNLIYLPNSPNYLLQAELNSICDSLNYTISIENKLRNFEIYPNPTNGKIHINNFSNYSSVNISVYTILGALSKKIIANENTIELDVTDFSAGIYFMVLTTPKGQDIFKFSKVD